MFKSLEYDKSQKRVALRKIFNAPCVWLRYPELKNRISFYFGDCGGNWGTASYRHDGSGEICISRELLEKAGQKDKAALQTLHGVLLHELQHQIQYAENWPSYDSYNWDCPWERRVAEREADYVAVEREIMDDKQRKKTPPHWFREWLC